MHNSWRIELQFLKYPEEIIKLTRITLIFSSPRLLPKISNNNRRKFKLPPHGKHHPIVFKKAEDIAGYEKFTLDEVVFPEAKSDDQVKVNIIFFFDKNQG